MLASTAFAMGLLLHKTTAVRTAAYRHSQRLLFASFFLFTDASYILTPTVVVVPHHPQVKSEKIPQSCEKHVNNYSQKIQKYVMKRGEKKSRSAPRSIAERAAFRLHLEVEAAHGTLVRPPAKEPRGKEVSGESAFDKDYIHTKKKLSGIKKRSCEIETLLKTHLCKLGVIIRYINRRNNLHIYYVLVYI